MNEDRNIEAVYKRMKETLDGKISYEVICVDDASSDETPKDREKLCK